MQTNLMYTKYLCLKCTVAYDERRFHSLLFQCAQTGKGQKGIQRVLDLYQNEKENQVYKDIYLLKSAPFSIILCICLLLYHLCIILFI